MYTIQAERLGRKLDRVAVLAVSPQIRQNLEHIHSAEIRTVFVRPWVPKNTSTTDNSLPALSNSLKEKLVSRPLSRAYPHRRGSTL